MAQREPQNADEWVERGRKQYWKEKNYEAALASFEHAVNLAPNHYKAWNDRGNTLRGLGRYRDAIASFDKALEIHSNYYQALNNQGLALHHLECYQEAIIIYNKALKITHNKYYQAWNSRGNALLKSKRPGRYKEAIQSYDHALQQNNQYWRAWRNKGWALFYSPNYPG